MASVNVLALLLLSIAVAHGSSSSTGGPGPMPNVTCKAAVLPAFPGTSEPAFCHGRVPYLIPSYVNETQEDYMAWVDGEYVYRDPAYRGSRCPFYAGPTYQCRKHFPECIPAAEGSFAEPVIRMICRTSCFRARDWEHGQCRNFDKQYFDTECNSDYYSDDPASCVGAGPVEDTQEEWKWVLVGILGAVGLLVLLSWARTKWRERMSMEDLDREEEARQRKRAASKANKYQDVHSDGSLPERAAGGGGQYEGTFAVLEMGDAKDARGPGFSAAQGGTFAAPPEGGTIALPPTVLG